MRQACTLMAQAEIMEGEIPRLRRVPCLKLLFQELCNAQAPGAQYNAHIRAKFANVLPFVPAFQKVIKRFLIDGEPKLREIFLATYRDCKAGALDFLDLAPESEFGLAEQRLLTEQEARAPKPTTPVKGAVASEGAAGGPDTPPPAAAGAAAAGAGAAVEHPPCPKGGDLSCGYPKLEVPLNHRKSSKTRYFLPSASPDSKLMELCPSRSSFEMLWQVRCRFSVHRPSPLDQNHP